MYLMIYLNQEQLSNTPIQPLQHLQQNLNTLESRLDNLLQQPATRPTFNTPPANPGIYFHFIFLIYFYFH